jgi:hypothetical protein
MAKTFTTDDVASHAKGDNPWIIIDEDVYDVSKFQDEHPGMFSKKPPDNHALTCESHANTNYL